MNRDGHIRLLPLHVANKIAAGEVVERPASVLKELLENALDAGATRIEVVVTAGGRNLVSVRDNGCGMTREDALLSLERQATSKIRDVDDIERIDTLGFRGEAIPSIASVSRFTLTTRRAEDEGGTRLVVNAGVLAEVKDCGAPPGTCVEVRDLFCNVPARRKFLRAFATEEAQIKATFTVHALAHPDVGFTLLLDGREAYRLPPGATLEERIRDLFGAPFAEALLPVNPPTGSVPQSATGSVPSQSATGSVPQSATGSVPSTLPSSKVKVHGYIERPSTADLRRDQFVFVNGRPATAPAIGYALREAYPRAKGDARPAVVLFIELPPEQVDVNVHPAKREVRFRRPADVREALISALTDALGPAPTGTVPAGMGTVPLGMGTVPPTPGTVPAFAVPFSTPVQPTFVLPVQPPRPTGTDPGQPPDSRGTDPAKLTGTDPMGAMGTDPAGATGTDPAGATGTDPMGATGTDPAGTQSVPCANTVFGRWFKFLAQTDTGYLILETDAGLVLIDPRAARARIAYERLLDQKAADVQLLLVPETVQLPPADSARIRAFREDLANIGFTLEEFGRDIWKIDAVPALIQGIPLANLLASIATDIAEAGAKRGSLKWRDELIAKSIAHSFAGGSTRLTESAAVKLVNELAATRMPYICPRGKPITVFFSNRELARKFGK